MGLAWFSALVIGILPKTAPGAEPEGVTPQAKLDRLQELFKWAEYDSVIALGESLSGDSALDGMAFARVRLSLGVAYYAKGRVIESAEQLIQSRSLDPGLGLDPLYADKEILEHYRFTMESEAYLESAKDAETRQRDASAASRARIDLILSAIGFCAGATGAVLAANAYEEGEDAFRKLEYAGSVSGNQADYTEAKEAVRSADRRTLAFGALGVGGFLAGGCMLADYIALKLSSGRGGRPQRASVSVSYHGPGAVMAWAF